MVAARLRMGSVTWIAIGLLGLAAIGWAAWESPTWKAARVQGIRRALLDELQVVPLQNCTLDRFGSPNDGGYLMCRNLIEELGAVYSYGVGPNDEFGCDVSSRYRVPVHQYDCFDPARPACTTGQPVFHAECLGARAEQTDGRAFDTLANQISRNGDSGKRLIVKIDIEGAEWDALMATPDAVLERIDQLPMELHGISDGRFQKVLEKLERTFHLVNLHFNNFSCSPDAAPFPATAYQVLFVNRRIGVLDPARAATNATPPQNPLNAPDNPEWPDCQLSPTP